MRPSEYTQQSVHHIHKHTQVHTAIHDMTCTHLETRDFARRRGHDGLFFLTGSVRLPQRTHENQRMRTNPTITERHKHGQTRSDSSTCARKAATLASSARSAAVWLASWAARRCTASSQHQRHHNLQNTPRHTQAIGSRGSLQQDIYTAHDRSMAAACLRKARELGGLGFESASLLGRLPLRHMHVQPQSHELSRTCGKEPPPLR